MIRPWSKLSCWVNKKFNYKEVIKAKIEARIKKDGSIIDILNNDPFVIATLVESMDPEKAKAARKLLNQD